MVCNKYIAKNKKVICIYESNYWLNSDEMVNNTSFCLNSTLLIICYTSKLNNKSVT